MTTRTDYHSIKALEEKYTPKQRGIVSGEEVKLIRDALEIESRNDIELQNIRDMVVLIYKDRAAVYSRQGRAWLEQQFLDAMSAICCVIDDEKFKRGMEV